MAERYSSSFDFTLSIFCWCAFFFIFFFFFFGAFCPLAFSHSSSHPVSRLVTATFSASAPRCEPKSFAQLAFKASYSYACEGTVAVQRKGPIQSKHIRRSEATPDRLLMNRYS